MRRCRCGRQWRWLNSCRIFPTVCAARVHSEVANPPSFASGVRRCGRPPIWIRRPAMAPVHRTACGGAGTRPSPRSRRRRRGAPVKAVRARLGMPAVDQASASEEAGEPKTLLSSARQAFPQMKTSHVLRSWTTAPPTIVRATSRSGSLSGGATKGSPSKTTMSASLPGSSDPSRFSANTERAASIV